MRRAINEVKNHAICFVVLTKSALKSRLQKTQTAKEGTCQIVKSPPIILYSDKPGVSSSSTIYCFGSRKSKSYAPKARQNSFIRL